MKNNILIMSFVMALLFVGCQKDDEYEKPNNFSDVGWYFSDTEGDLATSVDDYITFADLSQGVEHHEWSINSGSFYLKKPIERLDSIFTDKIIGTGKTSDKTVSVLFTKGGLQPVRLFNIFPEKVVFRGPDGFEFHSENVAGKWVIDTTFFVDVYDTIVPQIRVEQQGAIVPHESVTDTIYIEAGDTVEFFDETTTGRPDTWSWNIGSASSNEQNPSILFKKLGVFGGSVTFSRTGQNIPGDWETYRIPAPFKVIPSSKPFEVTGDVYEMEDETIVVPFNGEFAPFVNQESFFTVMLNGSTPLQIKSIGTDPADATLLQIKLNEPIYRPDVITVSYDGNGTLESTDTRSPVVFTDLPVTMHRVNLINSAVDASFEDPASDAWGLTWESDALIEYSTEQAVHGSYSMKVTCDGVERKNPANIKNQLVSTGDGSKFDLEAGKTYILSFQFYKVGGTTVSSYSPWLLPNWKQFWTGANAVPADQWTNIEKEWTPSGDDNDRYWMFQFNGANGTFYVDDVFVVEKEVRP